MGKSVFFVSWETLEYLKNNSYGFTNEADENGEDFEFTKAKCYQILDTISFRIERQDYSHIIFKELRALKEELANVLEITANKKNAKAQE